jgi:hypothetical protein
MTYVSREVWICTGDELAHQMHGPELQVIVLVGYAYRGRHPSIGDLHQGNGGLYSSLPDKLHRKLA